MRTKHLLGLAAVAALALFLSGCGRRGPLEPPPDTAQGQQLAKQRADQNASRGLVTSGVQPATPAEQEQAENLRQIEEQSQALQDDATPERLRHDPLTGVGETQMPFATSTDLVKAPTGPIDAHAGPGATIATKGGRKAPPIPRPDKSFLLDPLLE